MSEFVLEARGLTKDFKGFVAVSNVDLKVRRGTIHTLIGPNGAGKTTCFNLLTRFLQPSSGRILLNGADITRARPAQLARRGMVRSFQISSTFPGMTVLRNVRLGLQRKMGNAFHFWRSARTLDVLNQRAGELLEEVGLSPFADDLTANLPYGRKRALELATTLALDPELMLLDEPLAGMGTEDVGRTAELIRRVAAQRTVLMVEHNLGVVAELCDRITVLARGEVLVEGDYATVSRDERVIESYIGGAQHD